MSHDVECPYCGVGNDICHDDGYGYDESRPHNQECHACGRTFVYRTTICYYYDVEEAPCLNGGEHQWCRELLYGPGSRVERGICNTCDKVTPIQPLTDGPFVPATKEPQP